MSFQTGLSGLNASSRNLDVIGNNIANANTTGMKAFRAEFSGMVSTALGTASSGGVGIGVEVATVSQQFTQGSITTTGNNLDVAINGSGFFQLTLQDGSPAYTRDGSFKLDKEGYIITNNGANLMGYPTDAAGKPTSATIEKLQLPTAAPIAAKATTMVTAEFNLDARALDATASAAAGVAVTPKSTFGTSLNIFDGQGVATPLNMFFVKTDTVGNTWDVFPDSTTTSTAIAQVAFDPSSGKILTVTPTLPAVPSATSLFGVTLVGSATPPATGSIKSANPNDSVSAGGTGFLSQDVTIDFSSVTQFGNPFSVSDLTQDGYTSGELTGLNIADTGVITARYSNGQAQAAGQLSLADFRNIQGLSPLGGNAWAATQESGVPVQGAPGVGKFGALRSGALEESNVDLTAELVNMMTAQRAYQANAQTIKTQDQIMSTLVNLR